MNTFENILQKIKKYILKYLQLKNRQYHDGGSVQSVPPSPPSPQVGDNICLNDLNIPDQIYSNKRGIIKNIESGNRYEIDFPDINEILYLEGTGWFNVLDRQNFNEDTRQWETPPPP